MSQWFSYLEQIIQSHVLAGIFIVMVIENIGIPLPTELAFLTAQHLLDTHTYSLVSLYFILLIGQIVGAVAAYLIGRKFGKCLRVRYAHSERFRETDQLVNDWYVRYGNLTVLGTRLFGYVRPWSSFIAGIAHFNFGSFVVWTTIGSLIFTAITMYFTRWIVYFWQLFPYWRPFIIVGFLISIFGIIVFHYHRSQRVKNSASEKKVIL